MRERFLADLKDVAFEGWDFCVHMDGTRAYLQVGFYEADATAAPDAPQAKTYQQGRKWLLSPHMTKSEVIQTAFKAVLTAVEHEVREKFRYKGKPIFGPHFHVDALHAACAAQSFDVRPQPSAQQVTS
jgi:hypothetical protein